jgi:hypothetical protein
MDIEKINIKVDIKNLLKDFNENKDKWPIHKNRICLNNHNNVDDYVKNAGQRLIYTEFKYMNSIFKNTIWEETLKLLPIKISRARIMIMKPESLLVIHRDLEPRYHLALITDPACMFVDYDNKKTFHIPSDGYFYKVDTRQLHTFINPTHDVYRVHLVVNEHV